MLAGREEGREGKGALLVHIYGVNILGSINKCSNGTTRASLEAHTCTYVEAVKMEAVTDGLVGRLFTEHLQRCMVNQIIHPPMSIENLMHHHYSLMYIYPIKLPSLRTDMYIVGPFLGSSGH